MLELITKLGYAEEQVTNAYAEAERRGEIVRKSNKYAIPSEVYAKGLWKDGVRKGWIKMPVDAPPSD